MGQRWGPDGPPQEAYSRVSDPHRYDPLRVVARELLGRLEATYDVTTRGGSELQPWSGVTVETVTLVPSDPRASPLTVTFADPFGLRLGFGHGHVERIPDCGCDACDEDLDDCTGMLDEHVGAVTVGSFGERLEGRWHVRWVRTEHGERSSRTLLSRPECAALKALLPRGGTVWVPWPVRRPR